MDKIQKLTEEIEKLEGLIQSYNNLAEYHEGLAEEAKNKVEQFLDTQDELKNELDELQSSSLTEDEKKEVMTNLKTLETVLNSENIMGIEFYVTESKCFNKVLTLRLDMDIDKDGTSYTVFVHTSKSITRNIVKSFINVPGRACGGDMLKDEYSWSKEKYPRTKFFKSVD